MLEWPPDSGWVETPEMRQVVATVCPPRSSPIAVFCQHETAFNYEALGRLWYSRSMPYHLPRVIQTRAGSKNTGPRGPSETRKPLPVVGMS